MEKLREIAALFNKTSTSSFVIGVVMGIVCYVVIASVHGKLDDTSIPLITRIIDKLFEVLMLLIAYLWGLRTNNDPNKG